MLTEEVARELTAQLPHVARDTVAAVIEDVPEYSGALQGPMGATINEAVQMALRGFLSLAERGGGRPHRATLDGAYALGRGEARAGRSMEALLAAYRVGARVAWHGWSSTPAVQGLPGQALATFAGLVFAYIDELSAASVAGHTDELARSGRVRERQLQRLTEHLLAGAAPDVLAAAAEAAEWEPPSTLTAVLLPQGELRTLLARVDPRTLVLAEGDEAVVLVADAGPARLPGVVGPTRPWQQAAASHRLAVRAQALGARAAAQVLPELVLTADADALQELRRGALAPLEGLRPAAREKLESTLLSWLLHLGRRDAVAADLFVHPQTVRYRMGQLRELYGEQLDDPVAVLQLVLALSPSRAGVRSGPSKTG